MGNRFSKYIITVIVLAVLPFEAEARRYKFDCSYSKYASPEGLKNAEGNGFKLEFHFDDITRKAVMIGNNGLADVDVHAGDLGVVTFMEKLGSGVVQTTSITSDGSSVHSRHSLLVANPHKIGIIPSQYYGRCVIQ